MKRFYSLVAAFSLILSLFSVVSEEGSVSAQTSPKDCVNFMIPAIKKLADGASQNPYGFQAAYDKLENQINLKFGFHSKPFFVAAGNGYLFGRVETGGKVSDLMKKLTPIIYQACGLQIASTTTTTQPGKIFSEPGAKNPTAASLKAWYIPQLNQFLTMMLKNNGPCSGTVLIAQSIVNPNWARIENNVECNADNLMPQYAFDGLSGWKWVESTVNAVYVPTYLNIPPSVRNGKTKDIVLKVPAGLKIYVAN
jgi:hypothetical protein